ncbi:hypothetical protein ANCDUO_27490 [Ancylostoma duodenale]|uniref:non-specific serine/threonine protein kinase n=1 Tax=Ancylostoma duodenale TaxID=51022 RepID=A0A0C2F1X5_9BILA|nr:hypothetical protein ANCDUO_27490 [Ancylostoma duodenale]
MAGIRRTKSDHMLLISMRIKNRRLEKSTGTFGRVELTKHRRTGQHFALKILNIHKVIKTRQVEHVHNEKKVLNQLEHPFIVKLISTDMDDTNLYMIMEFIPGGELFSYLRASRVFSNAMSRFYAAEIVCALEYIHGKNIVYRDLKPENLMLCRDGHIKMADFGFAKELRDRSVLHGFQEITLMDASSILFSPVFLDCKKNDAAGAL